LDKGIATTPYRRDWTEEEIKLYNEAYEARHAEVHHVRVKFDYWNPLK
jgi:hypothetical protein